MAKIQDSVNLNFKNMTLYDVYSAVAYIMIAGHCIYAILATIFQIYWFAITNIVVVLIYAIILVFNKSVHFKHRVVLWSHFEIIVGVCVCTDYFGLDAGFTLYLIGLATVNYFSIFERREISYLLVIFEISLFLILYSKYSGYKIDSEFGMTNIFYIVNFLFLAVTTIVISKISNIAQSMALLELAHDEEKQNVYEYDKLTGAFNENTAKNIIELQVAELKSKKLESLSVAICNIDSFKNINDTYGFTIGDIILKEIYKILNTNFRKDDKISRCTNGEFIIISLNNNSETIHRIAEKTRIDIENSLNLAINLKIKITVSFGIVTCTKPSEPKHIINRAKELLFESKKMGKNKSNSGVM